MNNKRKMKKKISISLEQLPILKSEIIMLQFMLGGEQ
jgi:hypothetical protein